MTDKYILFDVAGTSYAVSSQEVAHIELVEHVTAVPNAPHYVDGVVFSRGAVVPAVNLRARFGFERIAGDARARLIVVHGGGRHVGLVVDSAREFIAVPQTSIRPAAEGLAATAPYLRGVATLGERIVFVLNVSELLKLNGELPTTEVGGSQHIQEK